VVPVVVPDVVLPVVVPPVDPPVVVEPVPVVEEAVVVPDDVPEGLEEQASDTTVKTRPKQWMRVAISALLAPVRSTEGPSVIGRGRILPQAGPHDARNL
jgi:hypothetical protein